MIDLATNHLLSLAEAARRVPSGRNHGHRVNASTLWRWCRHGVVSASGDRVHLDHVRLGGHILTSVEALQRFAVAQAGDSAPEAIPTERRTPTERSRESARAVERLEMVGV